MKQENLINREDARKELARRAKYELAIRKARERLLPFIKVNNDKYIAGWFNRVLCHIMEQFYKDVQEHKKPLPAAEKAKLFPGIFRLGFWDRIRIWKS